MVKKNMLHKLPDYFSEQKFILDKIKFRYLEGWYEGKGYLFWEPEKGFRLEAFVDRKGGQLTGTFSDELRLIPKSEHVNIRMKPRNLRWAIAPHVPIFDKIYLLKEHQLSVSVPQVIFCDSFQINSDDKKLFDLQKTGGEAFFQTSRKHRLHRGMELKIKISGEDFRHIPPESAFRESNDDFTIVGYFVAENCLKIEFSRLKRVAKSYLRSWLDAIGVALSFYYGETIELQYSKFGNYRNQFVEYRNLDSVRRFGVLKPFESPIVVDSQSITNLANFLAETSTEAKVCHNIYLQVVEASQQKSWAARELLLATILEAALRTLNNDPFVQGKSKSDVVIRYLSPFVNDKILAAVDDEQRKANWKKVRRNVEKFLVKLRHRNAHPDWLTGEHGSWSHEQLEESFYMQRFMAWFYGYMILAMAGCKNLEPIFPESPEERTQREKANAANFGEVAPSSQPIYFQSLNWS
jgi:hypothetical protein